MNTAILLSGGTGTRMGVACPKQYLPVLGRPVLLYSLETLQRHDDIDHIVIVAAEEWQPAVQEWVKAEGVTKFFAFAPAGRTRQHSIYNGLKAAKDCTPNEGVVLIHDAARPLVSPAIIAACLAAAAEEGGAMPVITVKDTVYYSETGERVDQLLDRSRLYAGQAPEAFRFGEYLAIHDAASDDEIAATAGTSQIACRHGMSVRLVAGSERNLKITTVEDLHTFEMLLHEQPETQKGEAKA